MRYKIDKILVCILWLLAATLGTCFWFNSRFGFNIFSIPHWQYLGHLQANGTTISNTFYVSIVCALLITLLGLYILMRPRLRRIIVADHPSPKIATQVQTADTTTTQNTQPAPEPIVQHPPVATTTQTRPPRLNVPNFNATLNAPHTPAFNASHSESPSNNAPAWQNQQPDNRTQYRKIFSDAGFIVKNAPRIGELETSLFAVGTGEILYIGAENVFTAEMQMAVEKLQQVFSDTLDDVEISIRAFIVNAKDATLNSDTDIALFNSINDLAEYINSHPNPPLPENDGGNFDAYSDYISTVAEYIGKI